MKVGDLVRALNKLAPFDFAESWDNVGLLVGDADAPVSGVIAAIDLGQTALEAAKKYSANVVICHHPPLFKPASRVTRASHPYLFEALRTGLNVISLHTNFDLASGKLNQDLAARLGCKFQEYLASRGGEGFPESVSLGKFITYVPEKNIEALRKAVCDAGAGQIGAYTQCSFSWLGEGTFLGGKQSSPRVGKKGKLEKVAETRFEVVFPWKSIKKVVGAAKQAHPYEEMAYDVIKLAQPSQEIGYGFVGDCDLVFQNLLKNVTQVFQLQSITIAGPGLSDPKMRIKRLAFSPGSGSSFVKAAASKGVDAYICGELSYHQILEARQFGISTVLLGHSYSERFFVETVAKWCDSLETSTAVHKMFETIHKTVAAI